MKHKNTKQQHLKELIRSLIIIIFINIISYYLFLRIDLTEGKRYSLSKTTKVILNQIDDIVTFTVYLEGDLPAGFKKLRNETKELLDEYRAYNKNIEYKFVNPSSDNDPQTIKNLYKQLIENKKLIPIYITIPTKTGKTQQIIFPAATAFYKNKEIPIQLLNMQTNTFDEEILNNSIQLLEYNITNALYKLISKNKPKIAFVEGHGELSAIETASITNSLQEYYEVERVKLNGKLNSLAQRVYKNKDSSISHFINKYQVIIIAKPDSAFNRWDKYLIDQFIMRGGKVLWLIDPVYANMDSLRVSPQTIAFNLDLNIDDMLFKYGVRLGNNLIMDLDALPIPAPVISIGGEKKYANLPWYYSPIIRPKSKHPIVNNLNAIKTEFISSIDTIGIKNVKKTILLTTSKYSRKINAPVNINLRILYRKPDEKLFNNPYLPIAVLLEGTFNSAFKNLIPPELSNNPDFNFIEQSQYTSMIVISDGDIIKNQIRFSDGQPLPLGYDKWTGQTFGNNEFILNCINYLTDNSGLILLRSSKTFKLRLLDTLKITKNQLYIQILNVALPVLIIIIAGIIQNFIRKYKYQKH
ncbi:MAG TPA: gliding motility-associated ABC transporter substrate-binding protein GldG [Bacteroidales bacterium]|nr:gliding motility-associated ABC transporter substrate-binding protein GldG [Bacteroidales bacterium]